MHVILLEGFQRHGVVITVDERTVYDAVEVTTDPVTARAGSLAVRAPDRRVRVGVSVTPGPLTASFDVDASACAYVGISLVGEATVAFETAAARPLRAPGP